MIGHDQRSWSLIINGSTHKAIFSFISFCVATVLCRVWMQEPLEGS